MTIYLGTIAVSFIGNILVVLKMAKDVENKGYKFKKKDKKNIFNNILAYIKWLFFLAIPVGNLILAGILIAKADTLSEDFIETSIKDGTLVKKEENTQITEEFNIDRSKKEIPKVIVYNIENEEKIEMSREEKLEFLKQEYE